MKELSPLYSSWLNYVSYDSSLEMVYFEADSGSYLISDIDANSWDFIERVNEFARQIRSLSRDFDNTTIKRIEKGLLESKFNNANFEDYLEDIFDEEVKESLRSLKDTPILDELLEKSSRRSGKIVLHGGLVGTAFWCEEVLYRSAGETPKEFIEAVHNKYPDTFTDQQCRQMYYRYLNTENADLRKEFYDILTTLNKQ